MGSGGKSDDPLWKMTPNVKCEIDFIRRQRSVLIQRKDGVCFDQIQRPVINHPENFTRIRSLLSSFFIKLFFKLKIEKEKNRKHNRKWKRVNTGNVRRYSVSAAELRCGAGSLALKTANETEEVSEHRSPTRPQS